MSKFLDAVRNHAKNVTNNLKNSNLFDHMGNRGLAREEVIEQFLRPLLPKCYGLGKGEVFSANGDTSKQIDIVIYDDIFSVVFFKEQDVQLFPCESVFGTIEVKSNLTAEELGRSIENIRSVKKLARNRSTLLDFTPMVRLRLGNGLTFDKRKCNPYLGYICSYDGISYSKAMGSTD